MKKLFTKLKSLIPTKRRLIQLYAALLFNANTKGLINGRIYQGPVKNICTPGLNCYSCPAASGACPLGSLQNALYSSGKRAPYYVIGIILLYAILLGRVICGFLCPFGFIQDLLYKIKTPKAKKNRFTKILSYLKYVILVFLVVIVPILYSIRNMPLPGFCKYICPAGTLEGALGLLSNKVNESELGMLGPLFTWKFALLVSILTGCIFVYRLFCRFLCPLGALYGLFNKISILGIKLEKPLCVNCGRCIDKCKMDISSVGDHECISCGECVDVCPTKAIRWKGSKITLAPNEIDPIGSEEITSDGVNELSNDANKTTDKKKTVIRVICGSLMTLLLVGVLIYFNFIDKVPCTAHYDDNSDGKCDECGESYTPLQHTHEDANGDGICDGCKESVSEPEADVGNRKGNLIYSYNVKLHDENGLTGETFDPQKNKGKITIVNFWGTWCSGCVHELPYFDSIASEYSDSVTVLAIHTELDFFDEKYSASDYVRDNYPESKIVFGKDDAGASADVYYEMLGGKGAYPITLILDENGIIIEKFMRDVTYEELKASVEKELNN